MATTLFCEHTLLGDAARSAPRPAALTIEGGRIAGLQLDDAARAAPADEVIDNGVLMPALLDTHVHVNEPGRTEWEGFETATRAAALGGVTCIGDMPLNSLPVTTSVDALEAKIASTAGKLWVDVALWGGVIPGNQGALAPMAERGARGFKCFLCPSGIDEFPPAEERDLLAAMPILRELGLPLLVHAELEGPLAEVPADADPRAYATYLHSRPPEWEDRAVAMIIDLVRRTGCRAHIVHLSSASAIPMLREAKRAGLPITAETCPHYLCLRAEDVPAGNTTYKCAPPIRGQANQDALWQALDEGVIDFVVTDHSPCIPSLKLLDEGDFVRAWGGIASLQIGLAAVWTEAARRGFPLERVVDWMTRKPGALLGLPQRGLAVGAAADLVVFRPDETFEVDPKRLAHKNPISAYEGKTLRGAVDTVWLRGERIVADGAIQGPKRGRVLGAANPAQEDDA